jgi:hypothetical protein
LLSESEKSILGFVIGPNKVDDYKTFGELNTHTESYFQPEPLEFKSEVEFNEYLK